MRRSILASAALPLALILAACSSGGGATTAPTTAASQPPAVASTTPSSAPSTGTDASPSSASADAIELKVAAGSGAVTNYLTGADGKTLYIFKNDTADSGKSTCGAGPCLDNWPPAVVSSLDAVKVDSAVTGKLALITRDDGKMQISYKGLPLYYFAGDKAAGDTNGQGLNGKWFAATP
jgi:predicted lipoprotein with Yx(FWY)xxD motif